MRLKKSDKWVLGLILLGYAGAALRYAYLLIPNLPALGLACPVCPICILAPGVPPATKFIRYTLVLGSLNAVFFLLLGALVWLTVILVRKLRSYLASAS